MLDLDALAHDAQRILTRLIRFNTVNPPGNERALVEWLADELRGAGLDVQLLAADPERPNLVARLVGDAPGPVLGYLSHIDTVLADRDSWQHDPWGGEVHHGFLWGRGAIDMKSQTAAEVAAVCALARAGWRPARGELKLIALVDEETGGELGAKWLTQTHPDVARCDMLINEGAGAVMPFGDRRLFGVCCAEKGTFRFSVTTSGTAGHASVPGFAENALARLAPVISQLAAAPVSHDLGPEPRLLLQRLGLDPDDPAGAAAAMREAEPALANLIEPTFGLTMVPTQVSASEKINVIPARATVNVDCRIPAGMDATVAMSRVFDGLGELDDLRVELIDHVDGNRSPVDSPLMEAIAGWIGDQEPAAEVVPVTLPAFTDSRWFRHAFPDCVAYGFFPHRHMSWYETWPMMHADDERIDLRDLAFAARFFAELPAEVLR